MRTKKTFKEEDESEYIDVKEEIYKEPEIQSMYIVFMFVSIIYISFIKRHAEHSQIKIFNLNFLKQDILHLSNIICISYYAYTITYIYYSFTHILFTYLCLFF